MVSVVTECCSAQTRYFVQGASLQELWARRSRIRRSPTRPSWSSASASRAVASRSPATGTESADAASCGRCSGSTGARPGGGWWPCRPQAVGGDDGDPWLAASPGRWSARRRPRRARCRRELVVDLPLPGRKAPPSTRLARAGRPTSAGPRGAVGRHRERRALAGGARGRDSDAGELGGCGPSATQRCKPPRSPAPTASGWSTTSTASASRSSRSQTERPSAPARARPLSARATAAHRRPESYAALETQRDEARERLAVAMARDTTAEQLEAAAAERERPPETVEHDVLA